MTVYQISTEADDYQYFVLASERVEEKLMFDKKQPLTFDGRPKAKSWKPPKVKIDRPRLTRGDFFGGFPGAFVASPPAWEKAAVFLEMAGQLLPLPFEGEKFAILNVTECMDCIDRKKSVSWSIFKKSMTA